MSYVKEKIRMATECPVVQLLKKKIKRTRGWGGEVESDGRKAIASVSLNVSTEVFTIHTYFFFGVNEFQSCTTGCWEWIKCRIVQIISCTHAIHANIHSNNEMHNIQIHTQTLIGHWVINEGIICIPKVYFANATVY